MTDSDSEQPEILTPWFWGVTAVSTIVAVLLAVVPSYRWSFSDTAHYIATARQIAAGNGMTSDLVYYDEQAISGAIPAAQTVFPPGYPILLVAVAKVTGLSLGTCAGLICVISWGLIAPLTFLLARSQGLSPSWSAACAAIWMGSPSDGCQCGVGLLTFLFLQ